MVGYGPHLCDIAKSGPVMPSPTIHGHLSQSLKQKLQLVDGGLTSATIPIPVTVAKYGHPHNT